MGAGSGLNVYGTAGEQVEVKVGGKLGNGMSPFLSKLNNKVSESRNVKSSAYEYGTEMDKNPQKDESISV